jgi:arylsulfatase A-like enzyme
MVEKTVCSLNDAVLRSPFIFKPPAGMEATSGIRHQLVELVDMTATIYDLLDVDPGYTCQGLSLCNALRGDEREIRDAVFAETGARQGERQFMNLDCEKMSPDSFYGKRYHMRLPRDMAGSYGVSVRTHSHKYVYRPYTGHHALFDLQADPGELCNLKGEREHLDLEHFMSLRLLEYFAKTADVIPYGQDSRHV